MKTANNCGMHGLLAILTLFLAQVGHAQPARAPVPSEQQRKTSAKLLDEGFGVSKASSAAKKQQLVKTLMEAASGPDLPKDDLYVVLTTVISLTQELRDLRAMTDAVDQLVTEFDVDAFDKRMRHLLRYLEVTSLKTSINLKPIYDEITTLARSATAENRYRDAESLLYHVDVAHLTMGIPGSSKQLLANLRKEITAKKEKFEAFQLARSVLESTPDDPDANFTVGRWYVTEEGDWELGLPHLAKSSNSKPWQTAAILELAPDAEPVKVGNVWWDIADSETDSAKRELLLHAGQWYQQALPKLSSLVKKLTEKRLSEIAALAKTEAKAVQSSKSQSGTSNALLAINNEGKLPTGQWIDLLEMVKLPDHVLRGKWRQDAGAMICEPSNDAQFHAPVALRGTYELNCEFTRRAGDQWVAVLIPVGPVSCSVILSGWNGEASGLHLIDGRACKDLPAATRAVVRPGKLQNGHRYRLQIEVVQNNELAAVTATLDGQRFVDWKGRVSQLTTPWHTCLQAVGVIVHQSPADIHKLEVRIKQGSKGFRLDDDWQNPMAPVASAPPKSVADKCLTWKDRKYFITDKPMSQPDAQRLASLLDGRLLTISSAEEEAFILKEGRGLLLWMSGWRRTDSNNWRDERNRPLRFVSRWCPGQPQSTYDELNLFICTSTAGEQGVHDAPPKFAHTHACIEWGEEYPEAK